MYLLPEILALMILAILLKQLIVLNLRQTGPQNTILIGPAASVLNLFLPLFILPSNISPTSSSHLRESHMNHRIRSLVGSSVPASVRDLRDMCMKAVSVPGDTPILLTGRETTGNVLLAGFSTDWSAWCGLVGLVVLSRRLASR